MGLKITRLQDIVPDSKTRYNVLCRVAFVTLGGLSDQGEHTITAELIDGSTAVPMKLVVAGMDNVHFIHRLNVDDIVKIRNICAIDLGAEVALVAEPGRTLAITGMNVRAPECRALPAARPPVLSSISSALARKLPTANFFVKVERVVHNAIVVTDHTAAEGTIYLHPQVRDCGFAPNMLVCLHRVSLENGSATLNPSGAVEEVSQEAFDEQARRLARNPSLQYAEEAES